MQINYFQLLGKPIESPEIQYLIAQYQLEDEMKDFDWTIKDHEGKVVLDTNLQAELIDANESIFIYLSRKPSYKPLTVDAIQLLKFFTGDFPIGISRDLEYETVNLGIKISFEKNPYGGFMKDFLVQNCRVSLYFDEEKQFKNVTLTAVDAHAVQLIQFKQDLAAQKSNINTHFSAKSLQLQSPVSAWKNRMIGDGVKAGDANFTAENLEASQLVLDVFLAEVENAAAKKSPTQLLAATKNIVKSLNKLNKKMFYFIETSEREELVPYIHQVIKATGLQIPDAFDITQEWREW